MDRMRRIKVIGEDMRSAGIHLSSPRMLLYLESIFISGDRNIAFKEWEAIGYLPKDQIPFKEYYELGIRMFCQVGNVEQALRVAEICLHRSQDPSRFRVLLPVIQTYLNLKGEYSVQRAWALYIRMNFHFGPQMTMEDYDAVIDIFITANQLDLALGVFKDMMLTGSTSAAEQNSTAQYRKVVGVDQLSEVAIQNRELNWEDPRALVNLPTQFNNRFFFGSWIKKLIGDQRLDAAKQVFDLMQTRRIKPDSRHMNGLIGAWFRHGYERSQNLAEDMAWRMIRTRLDFVKARNAAAAYDLENSTRVVETRDLPSSKPLVFIPSATIETFAILITEYRRREKPALISDLLDALRHARIRPNPFFMNELLLWHGRIHRTGWAWDTYYSLSREFGVQPDFKTYQILWRLLKSALDPVRTSSSKQQPESFITCRKLFADMMERGGKEDLPQEVYDLIILSFSQAFDQTGTAVALRALQQRFGMYPTGQTTQTIVLQLARLGLTDDGGIKPKRLNLQSPFTRERIANVMTILEKFREQRVEVLSQQGIAFDELQGDAKAEEMLLLLSDLLRYVADARLTGEQRHNYNAAIASKTAAEEMGVPDCAPWVAYNQGEIEVV
jgi:pentatricopeptide repeat protein